MWVTTRIALLVLAMMVVLISNLVDAFKGDEEIESAYGTVGAPVSQNPEAVGNSVGTKQLDKGDDHPYVNVEPLPKKIDVKSAYGTVGPPVSQNPEAVGNSDEPIYEEVKAVLGNSDQHRGQTSPLAPTYALPNASGDPDYEEIGTLLPRNVYKRENIWADPQRLPNQVSPLASDYALPNVKKPPPKPLPYSQTHGTPNFDMVPASTSAIGKDEGNYSQVIPAVQRTEMFFPTPGNGNGRYNIRQRSTPVDESIADALKKTKANRRGAVKLSVPGANGNPPNMGGQPNTPPTVAKKPKRNDGTGCATGYRQGPQEEGGQTRMAKKPPTVPKKADRPGAAKLSVPGANGNPPNMPRSYGNKNKGFRYF